MRRWLTAGLIWLALGGVCCAAPAAAGASAAAPARGVAAAVGGPHGTAPADVPVAAGRSPSVFEPTYRWHGLTVPVGACGAVVGGRAMVLPCDDRRVAAYRRRRVAEVRRLQWGAGAAAALAVSGAAALACAVRRRTRMARWVPTGV